MTPLTQQLEDKKKKLMNLQIELHKEDRRNIQDIILDEVRLKAEIAILEQAIAEMQKQRQDILDKIDKVIPTNWLDNKLSIFYGDKTFDERKIERLLLGIKQELKEQLNQPKEQEVKG